MALEVTRKLKDMGAWVWQLQRTDVRRCALSVRATNMPLWMNGTPTIIFPADARAGVCVGALHPTVPFALAERRLRA